ncbi:hypothetical protein PNEG_01706 [Pneumocystis murina B123]|uniref:UBA domain-containing protein n=1 Tax=Pneumocystis murina (strain B123) TaxID=1069680 RepID=M7NMN8_PNEMU|nr:hypothetical protein PNEG_01706 [Pneumocystis murina B123]EMR09948.1 hypothetical protein PNEG_01706 [Pneumocystis murina B123]
MLSLTPSGLQNTPITQYLLYGTVLNATLASIFNIKHYFPIQLIPHFMNYHQYWRILGWQMIYINAGEVLFGTLTFYNLRIVERHFGARKYASFIILSFLYTSILTPLILCFIIKPLSQGRYQYLPAGPTALIFSILAQYHTIIPESYKFKVLNMPSAKKGFFLSNKIYLYILSFQLLFAESPGSILEAVTGWIIGRLYVFQYLPGVKWRIPKRIFEKIINNAPSIFTPRQTNNNEPERAIPTGTSILNAISGISERPELSGAREHEIESIVAMGFTRHQVVNALIRANNDVEMAIQILLEE